jgi:hypothetical protein
MRDEDDRSTDDGEGLSTGKKVIAGAALGVAVPAAVGVARKLMSDDGDRNGDGDQKARRTASRPKSTRPTSSRSTSSRSTSSRSTQSKSKPAAKRATAGSSRAAGSTGGRTKTREQLYRQATRLKIEGRSSMTKAQLERAVTRAKAK